jgi:hypothetical protein
MKRTKLHVKISYNLESQTLKIILSKDYPIYIDSLQSKKTCASNVFKKHELEFKEDYSFRYKISIRHSFFYKW